MNINSDRSVQRFALLAFIALSVTGCATQENIVFTDGELVEIMQEDERLELSYRPESSNNLSLENAMALAVKYNLEHRVKMMEEAVSAQNFELAKKDQLPVFAANAGYLDRSNEDASRSISVLTRKESLEPSTSQEPERTNADLSLRWNLLDFGVSLLQMKQDANNLEVTTKAREKVMTNLLQQVRRSYWKAVAMEQLRPELADILRRVNRALDNLYAVREESLRTPTAVLLEIRALVETKMQISQIEHSMNLAKVELATLINLPVTESFSLASYPELEIPDFPAFDVETLETIALINSVDYASQAYEVRTAQLETRKAMRRLLPSLELSYGDYHHSNDFLWNNQWGELGARLTADITQILYRSQIKEARSASEALEKLKRRTTRMAVIASLHLSWQAYQNSLQVLKTAEVLDEIDRELAGLTNDRKNNSAATNVQAITDEFRAFSSNIGKLLSYADAQGSYGAFLSSLGVNPVPENHMSLSMEELSYQIEEGYKSKLADLKIESTSPSQEEFKQVFSQSPRKE